MATRAEKKRRSFDKILEVASVRMREQGLHGAPIAPVMKEAGLTHGAFYAHFDNKDELARAAFRFALEQSQPGWFGDKPEAWDERLARLAGSYLNANHRDNVGHGCAISALATDFAGADDAFRELFDEMLGRTLDGICDNGEARSEAREAQAIAFLALCVGGLNLSRAVKDPALSTRILDVCRTVAEKLPGIDRKS